MTKVSDERLAHYIEHAQLMGENGTPAISTGELADMARELLSFRSQPEPAGVRVKPLDWTCIAGHDGHFCRAPNPFGGLPFEAITGEQKARYDADYERCILSALTEQQGEADYWAVWSATGSHIGTWPDEADARAALAEYESRIPRMSGVIKPLYASPSNQEPVAWFSPEVTPATPKGTDRYYIVAVRRAHSGKVWTFPAQYLNAYPLMFEVCGCDGEPDSHHDEGCPCTGWYTASSDGEYDENYSPLLSPGDELVAWSEIQLHPLDARLTDALSQTQGEWGW